MSDAGPVLVTGGAGFAGSHLLALLREREVEVVAPPHADLDLLDGDAVRRTVAEVSPAAVFHLAALASVARSWESPRDALEQNVGMTLNVLEAVRTAAPEARVLVAGSGEAYGPPRRLPLTEDEPLRPQNPYAVSKAACELLAGQYADAHGVRVVRTRAFNHAGPGQGEDYVVASLTRQVAQAQAEGRDEVVLRTGNVEARRDFTDVRDVVRAYADAVEVEPGVYNVCRGEAVAVRELIEMLAQFGEIEVRHELDPGRLRPSEVPEVRGSAERLRELTGWEPQIGLRDTLRDALADWRQRLAP